MKFGKRKHISRWINYILITVLVLVNSTMMVSAEEAKVKSRVVRVGYYEDNSAFQDGFTDEARKSGYAYEYYQELSKYTGWKYKYVYGSWSEIYDKLLNGEVDIVAGVCRTDEREGLMLYPDLDMGQETYYVFAPEDNDKMVEGQIDSIQGKTIGLEASCIVPDVFETFMTQNQLDCDMIIYENHTDCMKGLREGEVDGIVMADNYLVSGIVPIVKIKTERYYFAVEYSRYDILTELNDALKKIEATTPYYNARLQEQYFRKSVIRQNLGRDDVAWLQNHQLKLGCVKDFLPYSNVSQAGEPEGVFSVLVNEIGRYLGTKPVCIGYDDYDSMKKALDSGEIDAAFPEYVDLWLAEERNYMLTDTVVRDHIAVIFREEYAGAIEGRIAVSAASTGQADSLRADHPELTQVQCNTVKDALTAVLEGDADCTFVAANVWNRCLNENDEFRDLYAIYQSDLAEYCLAVKRNNTEVYTLLNKALNLVDRDEIDKILIQESYVEAQYSFNRFIRNNSIPILLGVLVLAVLMVICFAIYLSVESRHRRDMKEANQKLQDQLEIIKNQKSIITIDALTKVNNRYQFERYMTELFSSHSLNFNGKLYMAVMDLDRFKQINDQFGHQEGDRALVRTANALKKACGGTPAFLGRYGGDEFVIVCESESRDLMDMICERIEDCLKKESVGLKYRLHMSIGIAEHSTENETYMQFFDRADRELYRIKAVRHKNE